MKRVSLILDCEDGLDVFSMVDSLPCAVLQVVVSYSQPIPTSVCKSVSGLDSLNTSNNACS